MNDAMVMAQYVGHGSFIRGIPARDLTAAEYKLLGQAQREVLEISGLYVIVEAQNSAPLQKKNKKDGV